jgi:hypothetical protein
LFVQKISKKMTDSKNSIPAPKPDDLRAWVEALNGALKKYSDQDWAYSRIYLEMRELQAIDSPYVLRVDWLDVRGKQGKQEYKDLQGEITWGERHSAELGILELISLRINKALHAISTDEYWNQIRPVIRLTSKLLLPDGQSHALWYKVLEVEGEEFENR